MYSRFILSSLYAQHLWLDLLRDLFSLLLFVRPARQRGSYLNTLPWVCVTVSSYLCCGVSATASVGWLVGFCCCLNELWMELPMTTRRLQRHNDMMTATTSTDLSSLNPRTEAGNKLRLNSNYNCGFPLVCDRMWSLMIPIRIRLAYFDY